MILVISLVLAFLPSLIWLSLFLREDVHPEPNRMVLRVFLAGALVTLPTIIIQAIAHCAFLSCHIGTTMSIGPILHLTEPTNSVLYLFFGIALVEEIMKYTAVRVTILKSPLFDEPVDALLYLVIAALGFAAVENALTVSNLHVQSVGFFAPGGVVSILGARSLSATLLHALTSGIVGYALARTFFSKHPHHILVGAGILVATAVHGAYNGILGQIWQNQSDRGILTHVTLLLLLTGSILFLLLQHLRLLSRRHEWRNTGKVAEEIS